MHFIINNTNSNKNEEKIYVYSSFCKYSNCEMECILLAEVDNIKYLGLHYVNKLKWCTHINCLTKNIRKFFCILKDIRYIIYM